MRRGVAREVIAVAGNFGDLLVNRFRVWCSSSPRSFPIGPCTIELFVRVMPPQRARPRRHRRVCRSGYQSPWRIQRPQNFVQRGKQNAALVAGFGNGALDFVAQFRRNLLVGVEAEQPRLRGLVGGGIFLGDVAFPRFAEDFRAGRLGDFVRAVVHVVVEDDDDFRRPAGDAVERAADARASLPAMRQTEMGRSCPVVMLSGACGTAIMPIPARPFFMQATAAMQSFGSCTPSGARGGSQLRPFSFGPGWAVLFPAEARLPNIAIVKIQTLLTERQNRFALRLC